MKVGWIMDHGSESCDQMLEVEMVGSWIMRLEVEIDDEDG